MAEISYSHCSLLLECAKCQVVNYMDPFTFWNFSGKIKCAGCDTIYAVAVHERPAGEGAGAGAGTSR